MKYSLIILATLLFFSINNFSQSVTKKYWIQFTDKSNSSFDVSRPNEFLSQRTIDRRSRQSIIITTQDLPVNSTYIDSIINSGNIQFIHSSKWFNAITVETEDSLAMVAIQNYSFVMGVEATRSFRRQSIDKFEMIPNYSSKKTGVYLSNNPHYPYGKCYNQNHLHKIDYLHDLGFKGQGIHIAVIDAGFLNVDSLEALAHVWDDGRILSFKDFETGQVDVFRDHFHGAAVLSIIGGKIDGKYHGTAPMASFHLLRSEVAGYEHIVEEDNWIAAAEYADSVGADIINTSLGYTQFDDSTQDHTYSDMDGNTTRIAIGADIAASKGIFLCSSAGNSGASSWHYISTPADADSTLTVGAVDSLGVKAPFSSFGPASDGDVKPNVASVGWHTYFIGPWEGEIMQGSGTSFSSPMMAGMVACLWQALPQLTNMEIKQLIEENSHQYTQPDALLGYGIPDMYAAYKSQTGLTYAIETGITILSNYPNPVAKGEDLHLLVRSSKNQEIKVSIYNSIGQETFIGANAVVQGQNLLTIHSLSGLSVGNYTIRMVDDEEYEAVSKFVLR